MPYVSDENLDEQNQNSGGSTQSSDPAGQVSGQPTAVSGSTGSQTQNQNTNSATQAPEAPSLASGSDVIGGSGQGTGAREGSSSTFNASAPTSSGQWTNLQNYLSANNGGQFGTQFAGNVATDVSRASDAISNASTNFADNVASGTVQDNPDVDSQVTSSPQTMSSQDQATFQSQLNGSYNGPQSAASDTGFQQASSQAQNAYNESQQAKTPGGKQALLDKFYKAPTYTSGEKNLDTAILSSDPNAQAAIDAMANEGANLPVANTQAVADANNKASQGQATSAATRQKASETLFGAGGSAAAPTGGALGNLYNTLTTNAQTASDTFTKQQNDISAAIKSGDLSTLTPDEQQIVSGLGIKNSQPYSYGVTESPYLSTPSGTGINASTIATADQAAQMDALAALAGVKNTWINSGEAGTAPTAPVTFDESGYQGAIGQAAEKYGSLSRDILYGQGQYYGMSPGDRSAAMVALNRSYGLPEQDLVSQIINPAPVTPPKSGIRGL